MAADLLTFILALGLIVCPVIAPVYDSAGFDTEEIMQIAEGITGIDYTVYASDPVETPAEKPAAEPAGDANESGTTPPETSLSETGAELISGLWYGEKSLFFGMASAEFTLYADSDGKLSIGGTAEAPIAGYDEIPFALDAEWEYLGDYQFRGGAQGSSLDFICNGTTISLTANPYELGFVDDEIADMDIEIVLTRVEIEFRADVSNRATLRYPFL